MLQLRWLQDHALDVGSRPDNLHFAPFDGSNKETPVAIRVLPKNHNLAFDYKVFRACGQQKRSTCSGELLVGLVVYQFAVVILRKNQGRVEQ